MAEARSQLWRVCVCGAGTQRRRRQQAAAAAAISVRSIFHSGFLCARFLLLFLDKMITSIVMHTLNFAFSFVLKWKTHFSTFNLTKKLFELFRIIVWFNNNKTNVYSSCRSDSFHFVLFDFAIDFSPFSTSPTHSTTLTANVQFAPKQP